MALLGPRALSRGAATVAAAVLAGLVWLGVPGSAGSVLLAAADPGVAAQVPGGAEVARVTLTGLAPAVADRDDVLTLRGVLENVGDAALVDPLPALRWSGDPLQSADEVDLVAANPLFRYGRIDYRYSVPLATLAPGDRAEFSIDVPLDALGLGSGVFVLGVDVLASLPDGLRVFVANDRTTIAVDVPAEQPLPVALVWPLAAAPSLLPDGRLVDDALAGEIAPGGRLDRLLDVADGAPVTWVVDPDLVDTLSAMADGYETVRPSGEGSGAADARRFLDRLAETMGEAADVRRLPAADPDVGGAYAAGVDGPTVALALGEGLDDNAAATLAGRPLPPLALLMDRPVTGRMLGAYLRNGVPTSVLATDAVTAPSASGRETVRRPKARDVAAFIARVPPVGSQGAAGRDALAARQWMLATSAVHATGSAPGSGMVVSAAPRWSPAPDEAEALLAAWLSTDWIEPVSLGSLPVGPGDDVDESPAVRLVADQQPEPVPESTIEGVAAVLADTQRLQALFAEPLLAEADVPAVVARSISFAWQADPEAGEGYLAALTSEVVGAESQISLVVSPAITLASRSGRFPITLVNDAAVDVLVGVDFTSQNSSRLRVENISPVVLTAGEKRTLTATALATANGRLQVTARLVTSEGSSVGSPVTTIVDVTNVGALGYTVIGIGGALLVAAIARSRWRARRADARADEPT